MTHLRPLFGLGLTGLAFACLGAPASAQVFLRNSTDVPNQSNGSVNRYTENVDFADVDLDGDWDAAFSHGGDFGNIQDRIWINSGGVQGGTIGVFVDETSSRFPSVAKDGRDVEFVDFDNDGDFDIYISNTSTNTNQGNQWFTNQGGLQAGSVGFYADETAARWVNLGVSGPTGSSIAASQLIGGSFIDWSCDCDFGDIDNDGDMDLIHSTYGGNFTGNVPTRMFLNDGTGKFEEFNPSGFQLSGPTIANGSPGIWCQGVQTPNTTDATGAQCDITTNTLDIDLGDIDGDFDLDLLHGDRTNRPRFFKNGMEENGGTPADLAWRDVSNNVFPANWSTGTGHYEQEMADFDGDNDLDLYGLNWQAGFGFNDIIMSNLGGFFGPFTVLAGSSTDDNEGDFGDYDNDGDLDLYVCNFLGDDRMYRNNGSGGMTLLSQGGASGSGLSAVPFGLSGLDAEWCDVDFDGDYDVFSSQDSRRPVLFWENTTGTPDTTPARVAPTENIGNQTAGINGSADFPVRTHVYDNAAYYVTWYNDTKLIVNVDGIKIDTLPARTSGGQLFRAELPSNLVGNVTYQFESTDKYGNTGVSAVQAYTASTALTHQVVYGTGTPGLNGIPTVRLGGIASANKTLYTIIETGGTQVQFQMTFSLAPIAPTQFFGVGIVNVDPFQIGFRQNGKTNLSGVRVKRYPLRSDTPAGVSVYVQVFGFDGVGTDLYSTSQGLEIIVH